MNHCTYCFEPIHADELCEFHWCAAEEARQRQEEWEAQIRRPVNIESLERLVDKFLNFTPDQD